MNCRIAYAHADAAAEALLRESRLGRRGVAYAGREYRIYAHMRVGEAAAFFAKMHRAWRAEQLADDLRLAGLGEAFEVRRLKRAYQRALVLAFASASAPETLVVEGAEEFDDEGSGALLVRAVARAPQAFLTYRGEVAHAIAGVAIVDASLAVPVAT